MNYIELITRLEAMCAYAPPDAVRVMSDAVSALEAQGRRLAALEAEHAVVCKEVHEGEVNECRLEARLAEAEALLREVSRQGQDIGGDVDLFDSIDAFLTPPPAPGPGE